MDFAELEFARPEWVWFVLPGGLMALAALVWFGAAMRARALALFAPAGAGRLVEGRSPGLAPLKLALAAGGWALLCVAAARLQWGVRAEKLPRGGTDVVVLVDVSNSMLVRDMSGNTRLEWAKRKISDLLDVLARDPDARHRVGIMPFAGEAFALVPPTPDCAALALFVDDLAPESVGVGGSDLAGAIDRAADELGRLPGTSKSVLVMSDGDAVAPYDAGEVRAAREEARRKAVRAARDAAGRGVRVFALGIGGDLETEVAVPDGAGGRTYVRYADASGKDHVAVSARRDATLAAVADAGLAEPARALGARGYVRSTVDDSDVRLLTMSGLVEGGLASLAGGEEERSTPIERFRWPLVAAFIALLAEALIPSGGAGRREARA